MTGGHARSAVDRMLDRELDCVATTWANVSGSRRLAAARRRRRGSAHRCARVGHYDSRRTAGRRASCWSAVCLRWYSHGATAGEHEGESGRAEGFDVDDGPPRDELRRRKPDEPNRCSCLSSRRISGAVGAVGRELRGTLERLMARRSWLPPGRRCASSAWTSGRSARRWRFCVADDASGRGLERRYPAGLLVVGD